MKSTPRFEVRRLSPGEQRRRSLVGNHLTRLEALHARLVEEGADAAELDMLRRQIRAARAAL